MPKKLKLDQHNHLDELEKLYRQASDPIERTRLQIIWLVACGYEAEEVAKVTGYRRGSIYGCVAKTSFGQAILLNPYFLLGNSKKLRHQLY